MLDHFECNFAKIDRVSLSFSLLKDGGTTDALGFGTFCSDVFELQKYEQFYWEFARVGNIETTNTKTI